MHGREASLPAATPAAWRLFLRAERCAGLAQHMLEAGRQHVLPADVAQVLRTAAVNEHRRALAARGQLAHIARLAGENGWRVAVLKGTADVARGAVVVIADVDVIASEADARALAAALDRTGYTPFQQDTPSHLMPRGIGGGLFVEVHRAVTGFPRPDDVPLHRARTLPGLEPLLALAPHDHAWVVLCQAALKHPDRLIRLRDTWMIHEALGQCSAAERVELDARIDAHYAATELRNFVRRVERGRDSPLDTRRAVRAYLAHARGFARGSRGLNALQQAARGIAVAGAGFDLIRRAREAPPRGPLRRLRRLAFFAAAATLAGIVTADDSLVIRQLRRGQDPSA
jgi:hypothetical protein